MTTSLKTSPRIVRSLVAVAIITPLWAPSCSDNRGDGRGWSGGEPGTVEPCSTTAPVCPDAGLPTYGDNLAPLLAARCTGCHGPGGENQNVGLREQDLVQGGKLTTRAQTALDLATNCRMPPPPLPPLSDAERTTFYCWAAGVIANSSR